MVRQVVTHENFFLPHKAVICENAESKKLRIVYDASSSKRSKSPSLNDCLKANFQNLLWSILIKQRFKPIALCSDLQRAILQIQNKGEDDVPLRLPRVQKGDPNQINIVYLQKLCFA